MNSQKALRYPTRSVPEQKLQRFSKAAELSIGPSSCDGPRRVGIPMDAGHGVDRCIAA
jgi:hypothetical protein